MVLAFPGDRSARDAHLQYLLGPDVLVAPVLEPGGRTRVYVPPGRWEPLVGLDVLDEPGWHEIDVPLPAYPAWRRA
jgi:alpha-D-xyloside xylohydrolase